MTIFYLDPIGGNDANAGTSFATRWKTITLGATAARTAPGDTIRIIKSPDAVNTGMTATFNGNVDVTAFSSTISATLHACSAAWTASTGTTTTNADRIEGTLSTSVSIGAGNSTILAQNPTVTDGAGFQQVTFKIKQTAGTLVSTQLELRLYNNTGNAVPATGLVYTIPVGQIKALNRWVTVTYDLGSPITAGVVNTVALYLNAAIGAATFLIDNIQVTYPTSDPKCITHNHLVSTTATGPWYPIQNIGTNSIQVACCPSNTKPALIPGTIETGSQSVYTRLPLITPPAYQAATTTDYTYSSSSESGNQALPILYSGGWNETDMSTQTGETFINGGNGYGAFFNFAYNKGSWITVEKLNPTNYYYGFRLEDSTGATITSNNICGMGQSGIYTNSSNHLLTVNVDHIHSNVLHGFYSEPLGTVNGLWFTATNVCGNLTNGFKSQSYLYKSKITIQNCKFNFSNNFVLAGGHELNVFLTDATYPGKNNSADSQTSVQLTNITYSKFRIDDLGVTLGYSYPMTWTYCSNNDFAINNLTGCNSGGVAGIGMLNGCDNNSVLITGTITPATTRSWPVFMGNGNGRLIMINSSLTINTNTVNTSGSVLYQQLNNTALNHKTYDSQAGTIVSDGATRHTDSGISWKFSPTVVSDPALQLTMPIGKIAIAANSTTTISIWMRRDNVGVKQGIMIRGKQSIGIEEDGYVEASNAINTWTQYSLTVTPTESGVVEVMSYAYGNGVTGNCWFDDISVS